MADSSSSSAPTLTALKVSYAVVLMVLREELRCGNDLTTVPILEVAVAKSTVEDLTILIDATWVSAIARDLIERKLLTLLCSQHRNGIAGLKSTSLDDIGIRNARLRINPAVLHANVYPETSQYVNQNYGEQFFGHSSKFVDIHAAPASIPPVDHKSNGKTSTPDERDTEPKHPKGPDGLFPPNVIRWNGKQRHVEPQPFRLLQLMWNRPATRPVEENAVLDELWGVNNDKTAEALKTPIFKANAILLECGVPWVIRRKNGFVTREE